MVLFLLRHLKEDVMAITLAAVLIQDIRIQNMPIQSIQAQDTVSMEQNPEEV